MEATEYDESVMYVTMQKSGLGVVFTASGLMYMASPWSYVCLLSCFNSRLWNINVAFDIAILKVTFNVI